MSCLNSDNYADAGRDICYFTLALQDSHDTLRKYDLQTKYVNLGPRFDEFQRKYERFIIAFWQMAGEYCKSGLLDRVYRAPLSESQPDCVSQNNILTTAKEYISGTALADLIILTEWGCPQKN